MPPVNRVPIERVRQLLAQGVRQKHIAERLGISPGTVSSVVASERRKAKQ